MTTISTPSNLVAICPKCSRAYTVIDDPRETQRLIGSAPGTVCKHCEVLLWEEKKEGTPC